MLEDKFIEQKKKDYYELKGEIKLLHERIKQNARKILDNKIYKNHNFQKFDKKIKKCIDFLDEDKLCSSSIFVYRRSEANKRDINYFRFNKVFGVENKEKIISVNPNFINNVIPDNFVFDKINKIEEENLDYIIKHFNYTSYTYLYKVFRLFINNEFYENPFTNNRTTVTLKQDDQVFKDLETNNNSICDNLEEYYNQSIYKEYLEFKKQKQYSCEFRIFRFNKTTRDEINKEKNNECFNIE